MSKYKLSERGFVAILIWLWICLNPAGALGAEEITHISLIQADTGRETALQSKLPVGLVSARPGDRLVLNTGRVRKHVFAVTESKRSALGNTIIRGTTASGGRVLLVVDNEARIKGHFQEPDGMVQLTTDELGATTAWREGIDTVQAPFECELEDSPALEWPVADQLQAHKSESKALLAGSKRAIDQEETEIKYARYATGDATVRILIYYDSSMSEYISRLADFLVELTNDALTNSFVPVSLELAGIKAIDIDDLTLNQDLLRAMWGKESPFETIDDDRMQYGAYLTATLRDDEDGFPEGENAGIAYLGGEFNPQYHSVTRYTEYRSGEPFYPNYSFSHEIGHNLSAHHDRTMYTTEEMQNNYGFSYAYGVQGFRRTIMSYWSSDTPTSESAYSNPDVIIDGIQMGVPFDRPDSADVSRAFWTNGHVAGAYLNEAHVPELLLENIQIRESSGCGVQRSHNLIAYSGSGILINSAHKIRPDGSAMVDMDPSSLGTDGKTYASISDCPFFDEGLNSLGTDYVESFFRYIDPATGELIESAHVFWEEDMEGEYSHIRVAHTDGGKVVGNTSLLLKEGAEHAVEFDADYGKKLTGIKSSCDGRRVGNSYVINVTSDDCRVEASFGAGAPTAFIERFYVNILGRPSDEAGLNGWLDIIQAQSASTVALGFFNSQEFLSKELDNAAFLDILYRTLFNRVGDEVGTAGWLELLESGKLRGMVIYGFLRSNEFKALSDGFGVTAVAAADESSYGVRAFTERFYTLVLGRQPDQAGFDGWVTGLATGTLSGGDTARAFFLSAEYLGQNTSNSAFVDTAYQAFFGREADSAGKQGWLDAMTQGSSRTDVLNGFIGSAEFVVLASSYGIRAARVEVRRDDGARPIPTLPVSILTVEWTAGALWSAEA